MRFVLFVLSFMSLNAFAGTTVEMADSREAVQSEQAAQDRADRKNAKPEYKFECDRGKTLVSGIASVYGLNNGSGDGARQPLAGGGRLDVKALTAAMLPPQGLHTYVEVYNKRTKKSVVVKVNDRGPYHKGRVIDLTPAAAAAIGTPHTGLGGTDPVTVHPCKRVRSN